MLMMETHLRVIDVHREEIRELSRDELSPVNSDELLWKAPSCEAGDSALSNVGLADVRLKPHFRPFAM